MSCCALINGVKASFACCIRLSATSSPSTNRLTALDTDKTPLPAPDKAPSPISDSVPRLYFLGSVVVVISKLDLDLL
jgi:hypothetical protein